MGESALLRMLQSSPGGLHQQQHQQQQQVSLSF
jgi:hypothetical protein